MGQRIQANKDKKENQELGNQKRGHNHIDNRDMKGNEGQGKRLMVQADQLDLYDVQDGVTSLEWPQIIQLSF